MAFIYPPETASGVVDGSNKTFTLSSNIYQISYIVLDGVIYTGNVTFIPATNTFLLADAPTALSPQVAYYNSVPSLPSGVGITVAEVRSEFLKRKKDTSDIDAISGTFLQWLNYANRFAYRELASVQPEQYIKTQLYTTVGGTATYAFPSDFQDINPQGTGLYEVNSAGVDTDTRLAITNFGSTKNGFYMNSTAFTMTPMPSQTRVFRLRYIPQLSELTLETEEMIVPRRFSYYLMDYLDSCYLVWDELSNDEAWNDERVQNKLHELIQFIKPDGQVAVIPDFSSEYYY